MSHDESKEMSTPSECAGTSFWVPLEELTSKGTTNEQWLARVRTQCESASFRLFCERYGMQSPLFKWNVPRDKVLNRFFEACRSLSSGCVSAVFHGTPHQNIMNIMLNGLDPKRRRGQAYGPGEYFGKDPGTSSSYCHGGKQMCVFLVVVPKAPKQEADTVVPKSRPNDSFNKPFEMIVVENNNHQLPLGVLKFSGVDLKTLRDSRDKKRQLQILNQKVLEKENQHKLAAKKAKIIQLIIHRELESAGSHYNRIKADLDDASKKEIGMYAHEVYDEEFISFYFEGGLPKPNHGHANEEFSNSLTRTVEELEEDWKQASAQLDSATKTMDATEWWEHIGKSPRLGEANQSGSPRRGAKENSNNANRKS